MTPRFVEPVRSARAPELAAAQTLDAIERLGLGAGTRLPDLAELADELEVSPPTVRAALAILEKSGVVSVRRGGGGGIYLLADVLPTMTLSTDELDERMIVDVVGARRVLEGAIIARSTVVADERDFEAMKRTVDLLAANLDATEGAGRADAMFHRAVVRASHSRTLERSLSEVDRLLRPIRAAYPPDAREHRRTLDVHTRQLAAMRRRDVDAALSVADEHFRLLENMIARRRGVSWTSLFGVGG